MKAIESFTAMAVTAILCTVIPSASVFAQENPKLSDAEVASVAVVANQIDISYGEIAKEKSKNEDVLKFAETMISDHKAVIAQAATLVKKLGVTPKDNAVSQKLLADAEKTKKTLLSKSGQTFNKAYIDNEVAYHKAVITAVEGILIPETDNKELKDLLENVVPALKSHLEHAIMVQNRLPK
jgi:putative membrane protein